MTTSITTINSTDLITNSRTDINNNFASLNTNKIETSVLDTDTTLAANSDLKVATQKAVKAYVDSGGNANASTTAKGIVQEATAAQVTAGTAAGNTGARLFVNPSTLLTAGLFKFGGTGADGALAIASGTTTIDLANAAVVVKNYTSISITGTGVLAFINPNTNGTVIILKSQGAVTLTSSVAPMIDASGMGASGDGYSFSILKSNVGTAPVAYNVPGNGGALPVLNSANIVKNALSGKYPFLIPGAGGASSAQAGGGAGGSAINGGGGGANGANAGNTATGSPGRGGGVLIIECAGAWNFTTASGISVAGVNATATSGANGGGCGGGGAGIFWATYNTLTANSGTVTVTGGTGATGSGTGGTGGNGGAGYSFTGANTEFS